MAADAATTTGHRSLPLVLLYSQFGDELGLNLKIRHGAIVDNVVNYVYAKFDDDRLWNEKALAYRKSDNISKKKNKINVERRRWPLGTRSRLQH